MPDSPPVSVPPCLANSMKIITKPSVAIARKTSSSRSTGIASSRPMAVAISAARTIAIGIGKPSLDVSIAAP